MSAKILSDKDTSTVIAAIGATGVFVTCGRETPNIMVTHTGTIGKLWGRNVFMLPVRSSKYSYRIITQTKSFALNVPAHDMRTEISLCDSISGFKCNKFETLNLHPKRARTIDAYVLGECGLIVEFNVVAAIPPEAINKETDDLFVTERAHTLFVGEVADVYRLR
ncbi:MAG: flavin reductase [Roseburia sp.]|nr:flavin reductase [Roseburia sp.]